MTDEQRRNFLASLQEMVEIARAMECFGAASILCTLSAAVSEGTENNLAAITVQYSKQRIARLDMERDR